MSVKGSHGLRDGRHPGARLNLIDDVIYIFEATWGSHTTGKANDFFDSIQFHDEPLVTEQLSAITQPEEPVGQQKVDILKLLDLERHSTTGNWIEYESGVASPPDIAGAILSCPTTVPGF